MIIGQAILAPFLKFISRLFYFKQNFIRKLYDWNIIKKNNTALRLTKGKELPTAWAYSLNTKLVWFGFIYGIISPICLAIATLGMFLHWKYEKVLMNYRYSIPPYGGIKINNTLLNLLDWTPLFVGLLILFEYKVFQDLRGYETDTRVIVLLSFNIAMGVISILTPWNDILKKCIKIEQT